MSENMKKQIVESLKKEMAAILGAEAGKNDVEKLANSALSDIDWNNSTLMHKDMKWIASYYLQKQKIA